MNYDEWSCKSQSLFDLFSRKLMWNRHVKNVVAIGICRVTFAMGAKNPSAVTISRMNSVLYDACSVTKMDYYDVTCVWTNRNDVTTVFWFRHFRDIYYYIGHQEVPLCQRFVILWRFIYFYNLITVRNITVNKMIMNELQFYACLSTCHKSNCVCVWLQWTFMLML